jgi:thiamine-monophosphate kinase
VCQHKYLDDIVCDFTLNLANLLLMRKEFEFINNIKRQFKLDKIGDDCAVLPQDSLKQLVISTDLIVEDIDFKRDWIIPKLLGHKSLAVSLSDIAAMGGKPVWSLLSIGIPNDVWQTNFVDEFYDGYLSLAKQFNVELVGGDVSRTSDKIVLDSIIGGEVKRNKAVMRSTANVGDIIFVTGKLGSASAGLNLLEKGFRYSANETTWRNDLILKQLSPLPPVIDGQKLSKIATSMIDISDGLTSDLQHICDASNVGAKIYADKIPIHNKITQLTKNFNKQLDFALNGGEDYELLFTVKPNKYKSLPYYLIGEITDKPNVIELKIAGETELLEPKGFQHF